MYSLVRGKFICAQGQCGAPPRSDCYLEYELDSCCGKQRCGKNFLFEFLILTLISN